MDNFGAREAMRSNAARHNECDCTLNAIMCKCDFEQEAVLVITNYTVIIQPEGKSL